MVIVVIYAGEKNNFKFFDFLPFEIVEDLPTP